VQEKLTNHRDYPYYRKTYSSKSGKAPDYRDTARAKWAKESLEQFFSLLQSVGFWTNRMDDELQPQPTRFEICADHPKERCIHRLQK